MITIVENPLVMGGAPVFEGTRVTIDVIISCEDSGMSVLDIQQHYPFITLAHLKAAREYQKQHPRTAAPRRPWPSPWQQVSRKVVRPPKGF